LSGQLVNKTVIVYLLS